MGLAFGAGLVAALNPCGFAMLPAYLALVVRGEDVGRRTAVGRALAATTAMAAGFLVVFAGFGLLTVSAATAVQRYLPYVTVLIGIVLVALGIWLLVGREITVLRGLPRARWAPTARLGSMFAYGISYAIASLSCTVGPFLAVTAAGLRDDSVVGGVAVYVAYAAGFALVVGVSRWARRWPVRRPSTGCAELCRMSTGSAVYFLWLSASMSVTTASTKSGCSRPMAIPTTR